MLSKLLGHRFDAWSAPEIDGNAAGPAKRWRV
jgi:hypothetical protein